VAGWTLVGLTALSVGALLIPTSVVSTLINARLPGPVYLEHVGGWWWNGHATLRIQNRGTSPLVFPDFHWRVSPIRALNRDKALLIWTAGNPPATLTKSGRNWTLKDFAFSTDMQDLMDAFRYRSYRFTGQARVQARQVVAHSPQFSFPNRLDATLDWTNAAMSMPGAPSNRTPLMKLGTVRLEVHATAEARPSVVITSLGGWLQGRVAGDTLTLAEALPGLKVSPQAPAWFKQAWTAYLSGTPLRLEEQPDGTVVTIRPVR